MRRGAYLKTADEGVGDVVLEQLASRVVFAGPAPHVFSLALRFALVQDASANGPHDDAEDEEGDGEDGVIGCYLFRPVVASSCVCY